MDWTMIANAEGPAMRVQTFYYLLKSRYQLNVSEAAEQITKESRENPICSSIMHEIKNEIERPTVDLGMGEAFSDADVRLYFQALLSNFEE